MKRVVLLCSLYCTVSAACTGPMRDRNTGASAEEQPAQKLIDQQSWHTYDPALDPLGSHQPLEILCDRSGWYVEFDVLEVDTGRCNYVLLEHPALTRVERGDMIELELRHFDLRADEPALAHAAIVFGEHVQWEQQFAIPGPAAVTHVEFPAKDALDRGDPIRLHLHNHGQNTWGLVSLGVHH